MGKLYKNKIPIRNIYYMLSYAYDFLDNGELNSYGNEKFEDMYEMLSLILIQAVYSQIKKGLYKEYVDKKDDLNYVKGKINISKTIKNSFNGNLMVNCNFDEYSLNNVYNQIIKSTFILLKSKDINSETQRKIDNCLNYFTEVDVIQLTNSFNWQKVFYNKNNKTYKMIIDICYLINDSLIMTDDSSNNKIDIYFDENKMAKLYEKFIFEFYKRELDDSIVYYQKKFNYQSVTGDIIDFIPTLFTDITITKGRKTLIIDAKFYQNTLNKNEFYNNEKVHSTHLSQLYTYINNIPTDNEVSGMLIYPTIDFEFNKSGTIQGNSIYVNTINLNETFEKIKEKMLLIINNVFGN